MELKKHQEQVLRTDCPYDQKLEKRLSNLARLLHGVLGIVSEVGEFADEVKKHIYYGANLDSVNLVEESGDLSWYLFLMLDEVASISGISLEQILQCNIEKLKLRYPEKFTEEHAATRLDKCVKETTYSVPNLEGRYDYDLAKQLLAADIQKELDDFSPLGYFFTASVCPSMVFTSEEQLVDAIKRYHEK